MNSTSILALLGDLYAQVADLQTENRDLRQENAALRRADADSVTQPDAPPADPPASA